MEYLKKILLYKAGLYGSIIWDRLQSYRPASDGHGPGLPDSRNVPKS